MNTKMNNFNNMSYSFPIWINDQWLSLGTETICLLQYSNDRLTLKRTFYKSKMLYSILYQRIMHKIVLLYEYVQITGYKEVFERVKS